ncbi:MAG: DMT family transporter [Proteobacteria bacterium]|nr:DMT family transporter [Pseudomonadota bacterium]
MRPQRFKAIGLMLAGVFVFSLMDAGLKRLSTEYPSIEVTALRAAASLPFLLAWIAWSRAWGRLAVGSPLMYVVRVALGILMLVTFIYSVSVQPLSDSYAVFMSAPLMVAALSHVFLGERVPARRWLAIGAGLAGVLIALKPRGAGLVSTGGLAAAASAACYALSVILIRVLGRTDSNYAMVLWYVLALAAAAAAMAAPGWQPVATAHWPVIACIGVTGALGQSLFTAAFRLGPSSTVAPFEYTALVWGLALDYLVFGHAPLPRVLLGGAIVIAAGVYVIWDEHRATATEPLGGH